MDILALTMKNKPSSLVFPIITDLLDYPSPPGHESLMADHVSKLISETGWSFERDGSGNICVDVPGRDEDAGRMVVAAHMDEIAMVVTAVAPNGDLSVDRSGGLFPAKIGEGPVDVFGSGGSVRGVLSFGSMHRRNAGETTITWPDAKIITGLTDASLAEAGIHVGSQALPIREHRGPHRFGPDEDPLVAAWTFDDRAGVAVLLALLRRLKERGAKGRRPITVAFTVHEEGGCHGAKNVARRKSPEVFIAVDGCPMPPGTGLSLDGRPGVWCKDSLTTFDPGLVEALADAAGRAGTELQRVVYDSAASDASAVYAAGFAERVATVGHVRENSHGYEVARLSVFDAVIETLTSFVLDSDE